LLFSPSQLSRCRSRARGTSCKRKALGSKTPLPRGSHGQSWIWKVLPFKIW
jgi:hypothetical protein